MPYDPDQPRVKAGVPEGGEWTAGDAGDAIKLAASDKGISVAPTKRKDVQNIKPGHFIQTKPPERQVGMAFGGGGLYGKVLKVNPKSVEIETEYGGWGGKAPIMQVHKVKKEDIDYFHD